MHVARKQRVETYLDPKTVETLENDFADGKSAVIREAVNQYIQNQ